LSSTPQHSPRASRNRAARASKRTPPQHPPRAPQHRTARVSKRTNEYVPRTHRRIAGGHGQARNLQSCRFLIGQRLDADGGATGEPLVILDWMGAARGATVVVSTDGDVARRRLGNTTPARLTVAAIIDGGAA